MGFTSVPSMIDRPFAPPIEREPIVYVLDLPCPPSVNRIWRNNPTNTGSMVSRAPAYKAWIKEAGMAVMVDGLLSGRRTIEGKFTASIEVNRNASAADLDNIPKALFDFAQSMLFIGNDRHLEEYRVRWSNENGAARGCRLTLREVVG